MYPVVTLTYQGAVRVLDVTGTTIAGFAAYWGVGGLYTLMDLTGRPAVLSRYKVQPGINQPVRPWLVVKVIVRKLPLCLAYLVKGTGR